MAKNIQFHRLTSLDWLVSGDVPREAAFYLSLDILVKSPASALNEWVVGDASLLLKTAREVNQDWVRSILTTPASEETEEVYTVHEIEVVFNGPDLKLTADHFGLEVGDYVERFCSTEYLVKFLGFSPGFGYLTGGEVSTIPRMKVPRERVQQGAVAVAAGYACVYPAASPGGWNWIGHTERRLFDPKSDRPFLLKPFEKVKFVVKGE